VQWSRVLSTGEEFDSELIVWTAGIVSLASVQHPREAFITGGEPASPPPDAPADTAPDRRWAALAGHD